MQWLYSVYDSILENMQKISRFDSASNQARQAALLASAGVDPRTLE